MDSSHYWKEPSSSIIMFHLESLLPTITGKCCSAFFIERWSRLDGIGRNWTGLDGIGRDWTGLDGTPVNIQHRASFLFEAIRSRWGVRWKLLLIFVESKDRKNIGIAEGDVTSSWRRHNSFGRLSSSVISSQRIYDSRSNDAHKLSHHSSLLTPVKSRRVMRKERRVICSLFHRLKVWR